MNDELQINLIEALTKMTEEAEDAKIELADMEEVEQAKRDKEFEAYLKKHNLVANKYGDTFKKVALKSLKKGDQFWKKPDAKYSFYKGHYNRANQFHKTATYTCISENEPWGGGQYINAKAFVYIDSNGAYNFTEPF